MQVFSMLPDKANRKISKLTGFQVSDELRNAKIKIVVRRNNQGGVDDPLPYIKNPAFTLVIAGRLDTKGTVFAERAREAGVPEENIFILPDGQSLSAKMLAEKVSALASKLESAYQGTSETRKRGRGKVIGVVGYRGGVGRTTVSTSLAVHYTDIGGKVIVLDLGSPPCVKYHAGVESFTERKGFLFAETDFFKICVPVQRVWNASENIASAVENLCGENEWVIVDFPAEAEILKAVSPDCLVVVVDSDIVQCVEPTAKMNLSGIFVYNLAVPEVDAELVSAVLGKQVIVVDYDIEGCRAALAAGVPAYQKSEAVARGIGELAAAIGEWFNW